MTCNRLNAELANASIQRIIQPINIGNDSLGSILIMSTQKKQKLLIK